MSEEESFVILGSSPYSSLCADGNSLLQDAIHVGDESDGVDNVKNEPPGSGEADKEDVPDCREPDKEEPISLTQLSINTTQDSSNKNSGSLIVPKSLKANATEQAKSLATSFILGEVNSGVLKNSVYSQFPSLCSMEARAEDVVKLQNMLTEYVALKQTVFKVNNTMQDYYKITHQWREEAMNRELAYQAQVMALQKEVAQLREENQELNNKLAENIAEIRIIEEVRYNEQQELVQKISEKTSLIQNMRVEFDKLQQLQLHSYDFVVDHKNNAENGSEAKEIKESPNNEHTIKVKELEDKMSKLMAENMEVMDMKKIYIDEINCLKVNLTTAEELIGKMQRDIDELKANDIQKQEQIDTLHTQNEIYRRDFEMERADREKNAGEKEQYLLDLRALQRRNQELIEKLAASSKNEMSTGLPASSFASSSSSLKDNQRPVRVLDPTGAAAQTSAYAMRCPICSKCFYALSVLQSHVNACLDNS